MRYLTLITALIITTTIHAAENTIEDSDNTSFNKHTYGVSLGLGYAANHLSRDDDTGIGYTDIFYEYHLNKNFSFNGKYYSATTDRAPDVYFDTNGLQLSFKAKTTFTSRFSAYGRFGANIHNVDQASGGNNRDDKGIGIAAATGIEFNADNGFTSAVEFQYLPMDFFDSYSLNFSVGYSF